jgi:hypothetical protein
VPATEALPLPEGEPPPPAADGERTAEAEGSALKLPPPLALDEDDGALLIVAPLLALPEGDAPALIVAALLSVAAIVGTGAAFASFYATPYAPPTSSCWRTPVSSRLR